jgi:hypothetical protein
LPVAPAFCILQPHDGGNLLEGGTVPMLARTMPPQRRARERKARALVANIRRELKQELTDLRPLITAAKEKPLSEKKGAIIGRAAREAYCPLKKRGYRALTNERKYLFIVELVITGEELELALSRRIIDFHNRRHIRTRNGRPILRNGEKHYRWCFSDFATARAFGEQFGGAFYNP